MTPMRPSRIRGNDPPDNLAAIRGERVPDSFWYRQTRRCLVRGIRAHDGFAQNLYGQRPEFTRALNARAIMSNRVPDMNSPEEFSYCFWHPDIPAEQTLRDLLERYPGNDLLRYQIGRTCAAGGYTSLYLYQTWPLQRKRAIIWPPGERSTRALSPARVAGTAWMTTTTVYTHPYVRGPICVADGYVSPGDDGYRVLRSQPYA